MAAQWRSGISPAVGIFLACAGGSEARSQATGDPAPKVTQETESKTDLDAIVVTARRRPEQLQQTPISIAVLTGSDLQARSATNLRDLQYLVPNITFAPSQNVGEAAGNIFIRGIGQEDFIAAAEPGVGLYIDGVYISKTAGTLFNLLDVERIEVLRGPQGTLYGKNAVGGAINLVTVAPQQAAAAYSDLIVGNLSRVELRGMVNTPISDQLLVRASGLLVSRGGYSRRIPPPPLPPALGPIQGGKDGDDYSQAAALKLRWQPGNALTLDVTGDYSRRRNRQSASHLDVLNPATGEYPRLNDLIDLGLLPGPRLSQSLVRNDLFESLATAVGYTNQDIWGLSASLDMRRGSNTIKLIAAYRDTRSRIQTDGDGLHFGLIESEFNEDLRQWTGEIQFTGQFGPIAYTGGVFGLLERINRLPPSGPGLNDVYYLCGCVSGLTPATTAYSRLTTDNAAVYAQADIKLLDRLTATIGWRYSREWKSIEAQLLLQDANYLPTGTIVGTASNRGSWNSFTYRVGLQHRLSSDAMIYGSLSKGFKSGGFNARLNQALPNLGVASFRPETALTYEVGFRSEWLDHRLRFNATLFRTDYRDVQLRQQSLNGGLITTLIENAASARINGLELELIAKPLRQLSLSGAYGHLDARYLDIGRVPNITTATPFQRSPRHSFNLAADAAIRLGAGQADLHVDYGYRSREQFQLTPSPFDQPGYGLLGARIGYSPRERNWSLALMATNLLDKAYRSAGRLPLSIIGQPRQVGVQFKVRR